MNLRPKIDWVHTFPSVNSKLSTPGDQGENRDENQTPSQSEPELCSTYLFGPVGTENKSHCHVRAMSAIMICTGQARNFSANDPRVILREGVVYSAPSQKSSLVTCKIYCATESGSVAVYKWVEINSYGQGVLRFRDYFN
ncbi:hypothetical protein J6590_081350 [Homalodisca vitripennis]|nr:hypothetical protein J6590_081350 [Homalodisca vitripennis]